jgi:membrane-bound serine protease (ClpP class)
MTAIILLFVSGALLLAAEIFLPGGIAGLFGVIALLGGAFLSFTTFGAAVGAAATALALLLAGLLTYAELVWLPRSRLGRGLVIESTVDAQSQPLPADPAAVLGHAGVAVTILAPSGIVEVDGRRYEAFSRSGHLERGAQVTVLAVETFRLIVSASKNP